MTWKTHGAEGLFAKKTVKGQRGRYGAEDFIIKKRETQKEGAEDYCFYSGEASENHFSISFLVGVRLP